MRPFEIHPDHPDLGSAWTQLRSGGKLFVECPYCSQVTLSDIAFGLSRTFRFGKQTDVTVAQHSVLVSLLVDHRQLPIRRRALMHDAAESILCDVPRPVKKLEDFAALNKMEETWNRFLAEKYGYPCHDPGDVKIADQAACRIEAMIAFDGRNEDWSWDWMDPNAFDCSEAVLYNPSMFGHRIEQLSTMILAPNAARGLFLERFSELF